jgi:hypothetical protein
MCSNATRCGAANCRRFSEPRASRSSHPNNRARGLTGSRPHIAQFNGGGFAGTTGLAFKLWPISLCTVQSVQAQAPARRRRSGASCRTRSANPSPLSSNRESLAWNAATHSPAAQAAWRSSALHGRPRACSKATRKRSVSSTVAPRGSASPAPSCRRGHAAHPKWLRCCRCSTCLVLVGVRADGHKEVVAVSDGYRESTESWSEPLRDLKHRGMRAPVLAIGDGALGFWSAFRDSAQLS